MLPEQANRELESAWLDWQNCAHAVFCEPIFPEEIRYLVYRGRRQHRLFRALSAVGIGSTVSLPAYTLTGDEWRTAWAKAQVARFVQEQQPLPATIADAISEYCWELHDSLEAHDAQTDKALDAVY